MDFTSDSTVRHSSPAVSEPSSESQDLSELDLQALRLQEQRNSLLSRRNALLQEIQTLRRRKQASSGAHDEVDARLLDLVLLAPSKGREKRPTASTGTLDGSSELQRELAAKYDTLPLLNMQLRLGCLEQLYKHVDLQASAIDQTTVEVRARFKASEPFQVDLRLHYDGDVLHKCDLTLSDNVRWPLRALLECGNPSRILLGCFEFDRLRSRRSALFAALSQEMARFAGLVRVVCAETCLTVSRFVSPRATLKLRFTIDLDGFWPSSRVLASLVDGQDAPVDVAGVTDGLLREYGLQAGLLQLCKACLCL